MELRPILTLYAPTSPDIASKAAHDAEQPYGEVRLTPEDGRYGPELAKARPYCCEAQLARFRMMVEAEWFRYLIAHVLPPEIFSADVDRALATFIADELRSIANDMMLKMTNRMKTVEKKQRHDVIAMLTVLKEEITDRLHMLFTPAGTMPPRVSAEAVERCLAFLHLGLTSEDVTSPAHGLMLLTALRHLLMPKFEVLLGALRTKAADLNDVADPEVAGHSLGARYRGYTDRLEQLAPAAFAPDYLTVKFSGATGTHAALKMLAKEGTRPQDIARTFIETAAPELHYLPVTVQINPHDDLSLWCGKLAAFCEEVHAICKEMWEDSGRDVLWNGTLQKLLSVRPEAEQSGSSAMPQKVQVINIENAKGAANSLRATARGLQESLNVNRLQRELSDSRQMREVFGDVLPKLLQILQNMVTDIPKLTVNDACRTDATALQQTCTRPLQVSPDWPKVYAKLAKLRTAFLRAAHTFAAVPLLARTHNQPASPTTVGKELRVFAERFGYLHDVATGRLGGKALRTRFSPEEIRATARGILQHFLEDLEIYTTQRNSLMMCADPLWHAWVRLKERERRSFEREFLDTPSCVERILASLRADDRAAERELDAHYECLGEAVQTLLRLHGVSNAYDIVKRFTRGAQMNRSQYQAMIRDILASEDIAAKIPEDAAQYLLDLTPATFTGEATQLAVMECSPA